MSYHVSKDLLFQRFVIDDALLISEYDLENRRMLCQQKY